MAMKQAATPAFKAYTETVVNNARAFCEALKELGYTLVTGK